MPSTSPRHICRTVAHRLALPVAIAGAFLGLASTASAAGPFVITEKAGITDTGINVMAGQPVNVTATADQIWAGVWFTGNNGPQGWTSSANNQSPLPGARAYSLLASVGGKKVYIGTGSSFSAPSGGRLYLQINDDVVGNGSGFFQAYVD